MDLGVMELDLARSGHGMAEGQQERISRITLFENNGNSRPLQIRKTEFTFNNLYNSFSSRVILSYSFFFFHLKNFSHLTTALFPFSFFLFTLALLAPLAVEDFSESWSGSTTLSSDFRNGPEWKLWWPKKGGDFMS